MADEDAGKPSHEAPETQRLGEQMASLRVRRLRLVVVDGPDRGRETTPDRGVVRVGTHPDADLVLADPAVSRQHCELSVRRDRVRIVDHGSANGTWVEGLRVRDVDVAAGALVRVGQTTLRLTTAEETVRILLSSSNRFGALLGRSARMREVFAILERVSGTESTVLVEGESGTGKELAAEGIHQASARCDEPFVAFDCSAIPRELAESTLFGHVRGAFTGAIADRRGVFEEAGGGTLFLDEIGELPLDLQPKLLRVLEKREVRPVGGASSRPVDVRIVAATNRSLEAEVAAGRFREDLYYRVAVVKVTLPPLRSRPEDIPMLVEHFLGLLSRGGAEPPPLPPDALSDLAGRPWPGNVRELRNVVERAVSLSDPGSGPARGSRAPAAATPEPDPLVGLPFHEARDRTLEDFERRYLESVLKKSGGNVSWAARDAGVNRKLIQRLMKRFGLT